MNALPSLAREPWLNVPSLQKVMNAIAAAGGEARVAGGAVRNALLNEPVTEVDLASTLPPDEVTRICAAAGMSVHPTGIDHGTVTVVSERQPYEVTTLRHDVETFGRHARVTFTDDWQADAMRRDFTMNALYCDADGKIYDFTGGYHDIQHRKVRFVGVPAQRIEEDYLRILRFFRFHARFAKGAPDEEGLWSCVRHKNGIDGLSAERIRQEMFKLMVAKGAVPTLKVMAEHGILSHVLPYAEQWQVFSRLPNDPVLRLLVLAADPLSMRECWRLSNAEGSRIENLVSLMPPSPKLRAQEQRAILYQYGPDTWRDLVHVAWARSADGADDAAWADLLTLPDRWNIPKLPVSGKDLIALGLNPGPEIGVTLKALEDWWVASDFKPGKDELLQRVR